MERRIRLICYSIMVLILQSCLSREVNIQQFDSTHNNYQDFVICQNSIFAIDYSKNLVLIDPDNNEFQTIETEVTALNSFSEDKLVVAKKTGELKTYEVKKNIWKTIGKTEHNVLFIVSVHDELFLITESGIIDFTDRQEYFYGKPLNAQIQQYQFDNETVVTIDNQGNIWLGFNYGEWGGDLIVFSTSAKRFLHPKLNDYQANSFSIQCIFPGKDKVFMTCGNGLGSVILEFDELSDKMIFQSEFHLTEVKNEQGKIDYLKKPGRDIEAGTIDIKNNEIYIFSRCELLKGNLSENLSIEDHWIKVQDLSQEYKNKRDYEWLSRILKLKKMGDNTFVLLSHNDGIGVLRKSSLKLFK